MKIRPNLIESLEARQFFAAKLSGIVIGPTSRPPVATVVPTSVDVPTTVSPPVLPEAPPTPTTPITPTTPTAPTSYLPAFGDRTGVTNLVNATPTFDDEFDGSSLDPSKWQTREWSRWRAQSSSPDLAWTTKDSVVVNNGELNLVAHNNPVTGRYESGWIQTSWNGTDTTDPKMVPGSTAAFTQAYGYWEARIKFSSVSGMWNAFWVHAWNMPQVADDPTKNNHPEIYGTEMDVVEQSAEVYGQPSPNTVHTTTHANGYATQHISSTSHTDLNQLATGAGPSSEYHIYGLLWTDKAVQVYIDGNLAYTETDPNKVSKVAQMAILSNEIGSPSSNATNLGHDTWGTVPAEGYGGVDTSTAKMTVDYFRVWSLSGVTVPPVIPPRPPLAPTAPTVPVKPRDTNTTRPKPTDIFEIPNTDAPEGPELPTWFN